MGHIDVAHVTYSLPDGRVLLSDVSFRVGEGQVAAPRETQTLNVCHAAGGPPG